MKTLLRKLLMAICAAGGISAASAQTTNIIFGTDFEGNGTTLSHTDMLLPAGISAMQPPALRAPSPRASE